MMSLVGTFILLVTVVKPEKSISSLDSSVHTENCMRMKLEYEGNVIPIHFPMQIQS